MNRVAIAFPLLALLACSAVPGEAIAPDGGSTYPFDGGIVTNGDAAVAHDAPSACSPASVQGYMPSWTQPKAPVGACTENELTAYGSCLDATGAASTSCAAWSDADATSSISAACRACVADSKAADTAWGPIVDVGASGSDRELNISGCLAIVLHSSGSGCAGNYQALQGCEAAACADDCEGASADALQACTKEVDLGGCTNYVGPAACAMDAGSAAAACFGPTNGTFGQNFVAVASVFCLAVDAGSAGPDAATEPDSSSVPADDGSFEGGGVSWDSAAAADGAETADAAAEGG